MIQTTKKYIYLLVGITLLFSAVVTSASNGDLERAKALIERGRYAQAFQILEPMQEVMTGDPRYDHLLGVSAMEVGRADIAVFALERVIISQPRNLLALADLGKANFLLRQYGAAKEIFNYLLGQDLPDGVKTNIQKFVAALPVPPDQEKKYLIKFFAETGIGFDSNVNSATGDDTIIVDLVGPNNAPQVISFREGGSQDAMFLRTKVGLNAFYKLSPLITGFANFRYQNIENINEAFDNSEFDTKLGLNFNIDGRNSFTTVGSYNLFLIDQDENGTTKRHNAFRSNKGFGVYWQHIYDPRHKFSVFGQLNMLEFKTSNLEFRNVLKSMSGVSWTRTWPSSFRPVSNLSFFAGREVPRDGRDSTGFSSDYVKRNFYGSSLSINADITDSLSANLSGFYQFSNYKGIHPFFSRAEEAKYYQANVSLNYALPNSNFHIIPKFSYTRNDSNFPTGDYRRFAAELLVRWDYSL